MELAFLLIWTHRIGSVSLNLAYSCWCLWKVTKKQPYLNRSYNPLQIEIQWFTSETCNLNLSLFNEMIMRDFVTTCIIISVGVGKIVTQCFIWYKCCKCISGIQVLNEINPTHTQVICSFLWGWDSIIG